MRTISSVVPLVTAGLLFGCGGPVVVESSVPATSEHHGGILIPLTDNQAYVELLNGKREKKGKVYETSLVAYVLQPDHETPILDTPTSVKVSMDTPKGPQTITLKPAPDGSDPLGSSRFISTAGPFGLNQVGGEVTVEVGGRTLSGKFRGPR